MPTKISRLEMAIMWSLQTKRCRVMSLLTWAQKLLELTRHIFQLPLLTIQDPLQDLYLLSAKLKRQTCLVVMTLFDMDRRSRLRWINICTARLCTFPVSHWARPYIPQWVASRKHLLLQKRTHSTTPGLLTILIQTSALRSKVSQSKSTILFWSDMLARINTWLLISIRLRMILDKSLRFSFTVSRLKTVHRTWLLKRMARLQVIFQPNSKRIKTSSTL